MQLKNNISIMQKWIPRESNILANFCSKTVHTDNWSIDEQISLEIYKIFAIDICFDRFASNLNTKQPFLNSKYYCQNTIV